MKKNKISRMVHFADCDPANIVFYPNFYQWFDRSTEMLFRSVDLHWEKMMGTELDGEIFMGVPLVETSAKYKFPCRFGDTIEIESWIDSWSDKTFTVVHHVFNGGKLAREGREVRVWAIRDVDRPAGFRAVPIPDHFLARFKD